jgi:hypothetical protein
MESMKLFVFFVAIIVSACAQFPFFGNVQLPLGGLGTFANQNRNSFGQQPIQIQLGSLQPVADFAANILRSSFSDLTELLLKNAGLDVVWNSYKVSLFFDNCILKMCAINSFFQDNLRKRLWSVP